MLPPVSVSVLYFVVVVCIVLVFLCIFRTDKHDVLLPVQFTSLIEEEACLVPMVVVYFHFPGPPCYLVETWNSCHVLLSTYYIYIYLYCFSLDQDPFCMHIVSRCFSNKRIIIVIIMRSAIICDSFKGTHHILIHRHNNAHSILQGGQVFKQQKQRKPACGLKLQDMHWQLRLRGTKIL